MKLHQLMKITSRPKKRIGRGTGSGKGKTAGRGTKGQKARGKVALGFIGGTLPLYKKLPFRRGVGNPKQSLKPVLVPLSKLSAFKAGSTIDLQGLIENKTVAERAKKVGVKILNSGNIDRSLNMRVPVSASAATKIKKAGGKVESA